MEDDTRSLLLRIDELTRSLDERSAAWESLRREHESLKRRAGGLAHAINNPLTVLQLRLDLLLEEQANNFAISQPLRVARDSASRIARTVRILQHFLFPPPAETRFSLGAILLSALENIRSSSGADIAYVSRGDPHSVLLVGDPVGMALALEQLLSLSTEDGAAELLFELSPREALVRCSTPSASWPGSAKGKIDPHLEDGTSAGSMRSSRVVLLFLSEIARRHSARFEVERADTGVTLSITLPIGA